jgi:hypothetical protein
MLPPEKRAQIIAALKANPNARAVARQIGGVSYPTVCGIAQQTGIDLAAANAARRDLAPETLGRIIAALQANPNARAVARQIGVSQSAVYKIAKQTNIKLTARKAAREVYFVKEKARAAQRVHTS